MSDGWHTRRREVQLHSAWPQGIHTFLLSDKANYAEFTKNVCYFPVKFFDHSHHNSSLGTVACQRGERNESWKESSHKVSRKPDKWILDKWNSEHIQYKIISAITLVAINFPLEKKEKKKRKARAYFIREHNSCCTNAFHAWRVQCRDSEVTAVSNRDTFVNSCHILSNRCNIMNLEMCTCACVGVCLKLTCDCKHCFPGKCSS